MNHMQTLSMPNRQADNHPQEWHELRRTGIGGSDAAAVLGMSKWSSPYKVWRAKVYGERTEDNAAMEAGRRLEPVIRKWYADKTGLNVVPGNFVRDSEHSFICGNIDAIAYDGDNPDNGKVIEIKTARFDDWGDDPPVAYQIQVQHYLYLTGFDEADIVVLFSGQDLKIFHVSADEEMQNLMVENYKKFWRYVEDKTPPDPVNIDDLKKMFPCSKANSKKLSNACIDACNSIKEMKKQVSELQEAIENLEFQIKNELQDSDTGVDSDGKIICTWKTSKPRQTLDTARLKAEEPGVYSAFLKQRIESRTFLIK